MNLMHALGLPTLCLTILANHCYAPVFYGCPLVMDCTTRFYHLCSTIYQINRDNFVFVI